jgi:hypothetical protein
VCPKLAFRLRQRTVARLFRFCSPTSEVLIYKAFALTGVGRSVIIRRLFPTVPDLSGPPLRPQFLSVLVASVFGLVSSLAIAALPRPIPDDAVKAKAAFVQPGLVQVKGTALRLSPGAQIRDTSNRIVLPSHIRGEYTVRMLLDNGGQVHRVWILTPEEAAAPMPAPQR